MSSFVPESCITVTTVGDCLGRAASRWSHEAVVLPTQRVTYPEFDARVDEFAKAYLALGVEMYDKVGVLFEQSVDYLAATLAVTRIGGVAVPINGRYKVAELRHVITNSEMRVLVTGSSGPHLPLVIDAFPGLAEVSGTELRLADAPDLRHVVVLDETPTRARPSAVRPGPGFVAAEAFWRGVAEVTDDDVRRVSERVRVRDVAFLMYTSGTTANPKGAMLTHEAIVRQSDTVARTRLRIGPDDRVWTALQMFHIGGVAFLLSCCNVGATYVHTTEFRPDVAVRQLADEHVTVALPAFETIWLAILNHPTFVAAELDRLRLVFNIGVPERLRGMQAQLPDAVQVSGFGGTEACGFLTIGVAEDPVEARVNTTGFPLAGMELRVVDVESGVDSEVGALGEIRYRGYARFDGYYGDAELSAAVIDGEGWFHSGDMGTLDADGRLTYVTRLKDMLKVGGENVAPAEIESFLLTHPAVLMAQVVAAPDARYVEVACAFVVLRPGAEATEEELVEHCLGRIATFKVPRYVRIVDGYPMSGTKVRKHVLREEIAAELAAAGVTEAPKLSPLPVGSEPGR